MSPLDSGTATAATVTAAAANTAATEKVTTADGNSALSGGSNTSGGSSSGFRNLLMRGDMRLLSALFTSVTAVRKPASRRSKQPEHDPKQSTASEQSAAATGTVIGVDVTSEPESMSTPSIPSTKAKSVSIPSTSDWASAASTLPSRMRAASPEPERSTPPLQATTAAAATAATVINKKPSRWSRKSAGVLSIHASSPSPPLPSSNRSTTMVESHPIANSNSMISVSTLVTSSATATATNTSTATSTTSTTTATVSPTTISTPPLSSQIASPVVSSPMAVSPSAAQKLIPIERSQPRTAEIITTETRVVEVPKYGSGSSAAALTPSGYISSGGGSGHVLTRRKSYTMFKIEVNGARSQWVVYRRYSDIHTLHSKLKTDYPDIKLPHFPSKPILGNFSDGSLMTRRDKLNDVLRVILNNKQLRTAAVARTFFCCDEFSAESILPDDAKSEIEQNKLSDNENDNDNGNDNNNEDDEDEDNNTGSISEEMSPNLPDLPSDDLQPQAVDMIASRASLVPPELLDNLGDTNQNGSEQQLAQNDGISIRRLSMIVDSKRTSMYHDALEFNPNIHGEFVTHTPINELNSASNGNGNNDNEDGDGDNSDNNEDGGGILQSRIQRNNHAIGGAMPLLAEVDEMLDAAASDYEDDSNDAVVTAEEAGSSLEDEDSGETHQRVRSRIIGYSDDMDDSNEENDTANYTDLNASSNSTLVSSTNALENDQNGLNGGLTPSTPATKRRALSGVDTSEESLTYKKHFSRRKHIPPGHIPPPQQLPLLQQHQQPQQQSQQPIRKRRGGQSSQQPFGQRTQTAHVPTSTTPPSVAITPVKYPSMTIDDFYLLRVIGKGSYGKVMLARHKESGGIFAIKVISKRQIRDKPREIQRILSERRVLEHNYHHPFLVSLRYAFQTAEKLYFCLDYVNGGELFFHLQREQRFDETRTRFYAAEITSALDYLHSHGIVYRDLKPENCLVDAQGHIRLVDFGLAKELNESAGFKTSTFCGTPEYLSPEVLQAKAPYGTAIDWFALGTVVYEMLVGLPPFYSTDVNEMYDRILNEKVRFPSWIGRFARLFISQLLERDPNTRLGSPENGGGKAVMAHVFFTGVDWQRLLRKQYEPPFNPGVNGELDLHNIDPTFKNEPIPQSIVDDGAINLLVDSTQAMMDMAERERTNQLPPNYGVHIEQPHEYTEDGFAVPMLPSQFQQQQQRVRFPVLSKPLSSASGSATGSYDNDPGSPGLRSSAMPISGADPVVDEADRAFSNFSFVSPSLIEETIF